MRFPAFGVETKIIDKKLNSFRRTFQFIQTYESIHVEGVEFQADALQTYVSQREGTVARQNMSLGAILNSDKQQLRE